MLRDQSLVPKGGREREREEKKREKKIIVFNFFNPLSDTYKVSIYLFKIHLFYFIIFAAEYNKKSKETKTR